MDITFFVQGLPRPAGSKTIMPIPSTRCAVCGRSDVVLTDANRSSADWKREVARLGRMAAKCESWTIAAGPLEMICVFVMPRPKGDWLTDGKSLSSRARADHLQAPDTLKLMRAIEDALQAVLYVNDSQIVSEYIQKRWCEFDGNDVEAAGVHVTVSILPPGSLRPTFGGDDDDL